MPAHQPWNNWYHVMGNTYGTWPPGDTCVRVVCRSFMHYGTQLVILCMTRCHFHALARLAAKNFFDTEAQSNGYIAEARQSAGPQNRGKPPAM